MGNMHYLDDPTEGTIEIATPEFPRNSLYKALPTSIPVSGQAFLPWH